MNVSFSRFRVAILSFGVSPERKARSVTTESAFASITAIRCSRLAVPGLDRHLAVAIDRGGGVALVDLEGHARWRTGAWPAGSVPGELAGEGLPRGDGLVILLLGVVRLPDLEQELGDAGVERVLRGEGEERGAGLGVLLAAQEVLGDQQLDVEQGPLGVGRLRPVGIPGEVALVGGDRLVELALPLEDLADLELGRHRGVRPARGGPRPCRASRRPP